MKHQLIKALKWILKKLAQLTVWRFRPGIVGITGSVGKTSTKLAVAAVLGSERIVRWSKGNLNNELGVPLTILGDWSEKELNLVSRGQPSGEKMPEKILFWIKVILTSAFRIVFGKRENYPEILILEYGADRPGDIKELLSIARPNISIISAIGPIPVHVEYYSSPEEVAREKARIIECLPTASYAILNGDDEYVLNLSDRTRAHVMTFGFSKESNVIISSFENKADDERPVGTSFKLEYGGSFVPVKVEGALGKSQAYAAGAAASAGILFGMNLIKISEALRAYAPAGGRMQIMPGVKLTYIINDAYNASPLSMQSALETLKVMPGKRKVAVLGDMLEIGKFAMEAHEHIGKMAAKSADLLVTVGPRAKFIAEAAKKEGMNRRNIQAFDYAEDAQMPVQNLIKKGDLILIKGSRAIGLDKVVEEIKAF